MPPHQTTTLPALVSSSVRCGRMSQQCTRATSVGMFRTWDRRPRNYNTPSPFETALGRAQDCQTRPSPWNRRSLLNCPIQRRYTGSRAKRCGAGSWSAGRSGMGQRGRCSPRAARARIGGGMSLRQNQRCGFHAALSKLRRDAKSGARELPILGGREAQGPFCGGENPTATPGPVAASTRRRFHQPPSKVGHSVESLAKNLRNSPSREQ